VAGFPASLQLPLVAQPHRESDECLLEALRLGTDEAYEELVTQYQKPVYNLVYRLLNHPADTADVVQEVFLKVFRNVDNFRGQSSLKTWIYRISLNEVYNHRRWFSRHKSREIGLESDGGGSCGGPQLVRDRGRSAFQIVSDNEMRGLIEGALAQLNPVFSAAVILRDIEDCSYDEIAEILQVSLGTVKSRILRGREALRKALLSRLKPERFPEWAPELARQNG